MSPLTYYYNTTTQLAVAVNQCVFGHVFIGDMRRDLAALFEQVGGGVGGISNYLQAKAVASGPSIVTKLKVKRAAVTINFAADSLNYSDLDIYYFKPRRDIPFKPNGIAALNPTQMLLNGLGADAAGGDGSETGALSNVTYPAASQTEAQTDLAITPFCSGEFCRNFKIYKVEHLRLQPGMQFVKTLAIKEKTLDARTYFDLNGSTLTPLYQYTRGYFNGMILRYRGAVVNDSSTTTDVGTGAPRLNIVQNYRTVFHGIVNNAASLQSGASSLGTITTEGFINPFGALKATGTEPE